jgi:excinuclease ABC subunit B
VAIIDADKEGFLRSSSALIQTIGRAARHQEGMVIMYADTVTSSMQTAIDETNRRRALQTEHNTLHNITPQSVDKEIDEGLRSLIPQKEEDMKKINLKKIPKDEYPKLIHELEAEMAQAAEKLEFERAAELRDIIHEIRSK